MMKLMTRSTRHSRRFRRWHPGQRLQRHSMRRTIAPLQHARGVCPRAMQWRTSLSAAGRSSLRRRGAAAGETLRRRQTAVRARHPRAARATAAPLPPPPPQQQQAWKWGSRVRPRPHPRWTAAVAAVSATTSAIAAWKRCCCSGGGAGPPDRAPRQAHRHCAGHRHSHHPGLLLPMWQRNSHPLHAWQAASKPCVGAVDCRAAAPPRHCRRAKRREIPQPLPRARAFVAVSRL
jgi:hypothetical protein